MRLGEDAIISKNKERINKPAIAAPIIISTFQLHQTLCLTAAAFYEHAGFHRPNWTAPSSSVDRQKAVVTKLADAPALADKEPRTKGAVTNPPGYFLGPLG